MNALHRILRTGSSRGLLAIAMAFATCCLTSVVSAGGVVGVVIDGNLTDLKSYGQSLETSGDGCGLSFVHHGQTATGVAAETLVASQSDGGL